MLATMKKQVFLGIVTASVLLLSSVVGDGVAVRAQGLRDIRINELLIDNQTSYVDDHGKNVGWVELHNTGYSSVNIGGSYLSIKNGDATKRYRIPKNDARTNIAPQGYVIFFADSSSNRGTFHTNFLLDQTGYLALLDQGQNVVDSVEYDVTAQQADVSIGWLAGADDDEMVFGSLTGITPMQSNESEELISAADMFRERDPSGVVMAITAMSVVFSALVMLYLFFKVIGKVMVNVSLKKEKKAVSAMPAKVQAEVSGDQELIGEEIAAIALALRCYEDDMHDIESHVLTINRIARAYSPWSSKIYGINNQLIRK